MPALAWVSFEEGLYEIGNDSDGFFYDNEGPRHRHFLAAYALANRQVTNGEYHGRQTECSVSLFT